MCTQFAPAWPTGLAICFCLIGSLGRLGAQPVSILPLGDSLTWGYSASTMEPTPGGYRDPLYSLLLTEDHPVTYVGVGNGNPSATLTLAGQTANDGFSDYTSTQMDENLAGNVQPTDTTVSNLGGYWLTGGGERGGRPSPPMLSC